MTQEQKDERITELWSKVRSYVKRLRFAGTVQKEIYDEDDFHKLTKVITPKYIQKVIRNVSGKKKIKKTKKKRCIKGKTVKKLAYEALKSFIALIVQIDLFMSPITLVFRKVSWA